jgi:RNA polymerase-interacting CarD/CdnL/TRCF family regulator
MTATKKTAKKSTKKKWSGAVTKHSNALDLDNGVFKGGSPAKVAHSLEKSAAQSKRKKGTAYQSAMSMLNFYINRAGKNLPASKKKVLEQAKEILKEDHEKEK